MFGRAPLGKTKIRKIRREEVEIERGTTEQNVRMRLNETKKNQQEEEEEGEDENERTRKRESERERKIDEVMKKRGI